MFDKVTDKYEMEGKAIYYMPLSPEEHASLVLDLVEIDEIFVSKVKVETIYKTLEFNSTDYGTLHSQLSKSSIEELKTLLWKQSPEVYKAEFNIEYDGLNIILELDYKQKNIIFNVDPNINKHEKLLLTNFFKSVMSDSIIIDNNNTENFEYIQFEKKTKILIIFVFFVLSFIIPVFGGLLLATVLLFMSIPKISNTIIEELYRRYKENN